MSIKMQSPLTVKEAIREHNNLSSGSWGLFLSRKILISCLSELKKITELLSKQHQKPKRKITAWQVFFGKQMKRGYSPRQIAEHWKDKN